MCKSYITYKFIILLLSIIILESLASKCDSIEYRNIDSENITTSNYILLEYVGVITLKNNELTDEGIPQLICKNYDKSACKDSDKISSIWCAHIGLNDTFV